VKLVRISSRIATIGSQGSYITLFQTTVVVLQGLIRPQEPHTFVKDVF